MFLRRVSFTCRWRGYCTAAAVNGTAEPLTLSKVWSLWNEGNLFSLSAAQLSQFLTTESVEVDPRWKKAALVRQVEEVLQQKSAPKSAAVSKKPDQYRDWDKPVKTDATLDLSQSGFYDASHMAPKAFQLLTADAAPDLVVSRVNTTGFPGFPANCECYTLTGADADQSMRARYSKAFQWCVMNLRSRSGGEICVEFGKLLLAKDVISKNKKVVSAWTLQQRLQTLNPYTWVAAAAEESPKLVHQLLAANSYSVGPTTRRYDVTVRRANDQLRLQLNENGAVVEVMKPNEELQNSYYVRENGPDIRMSLRSRLPAKKPDVETYTKSRVMDVKADPIQILLPPEMGEVVYTSENDTRSWQKKLSIGATVVVVERRRQPLVVTKDAEEGERLEYEILIPIPEAGEQIDLNSVANEAFDLARAIADTCAAPFNRQFGTATTLPATVAE